MRTPNPTTAPFTPRIQPCAAVAFELYDVDETKVVSRDELLFILRTINKAVTMFGDSALSDASLHSVAEEMFDGYGDAAEDAAAVKEVPYDAFLHSLATHATVVSFVEEGAGAE